MTDEQAITLVTSLICRARQLEPSQVLAATNLIEDLGFDSLDAAELLAALHKETGQQLNLNSISDIRTVQDVAKSLLSCEHMKVSEAN